MGCNRFVETGVQCGSCYRWYHYKCEGTTEKEIRKLYPEETHYIYKRTKTRIKTGGRNCKEKQWKENEGEGSNKKNNLIN